MVECRNKYYWVGNSAKTKIMQDISNNLKPDRETVVFDYGCGEGGDWPSFLSDHPQVKLYAYEPNKRNADIAIHRLRGFNADIFSGKILLNMDFKVDFIVSFSVFEHVKDRNAYMQTAKKHLSEGGMFYLNYDDGHFRNYLNLNRPGLWYGQLKEWIHNFSAGPLANLGWDTRFQRRVDRKEVEELVQRNGFRIIKSEYSNLQSLKIMQKSIPLTLQQEFAALWLDIEKKLNETFGVEGEEYCGDTMNLWAQMYSRTLYLAHY